MPRYQITHPSTGKTVTVEGSKPPTQQDAERIFADAGLNKTEEKEHGLLGKMFPNITNVMGQRADDWKPSDALNYDKQKELSMNPEGVDNSLGVMSELMSYLMPNQFGKGATATSRVARTAAQSGLQGATFGAGNIENENLKDVATRAVKEGVPAAITGGIVQGGIEGVGAVKNAIKGSLQAKAPEVFRNTLKESNPSQIGIKKQGGIEKLMKTADKYDVPLKKDKLQTAFANYQDEFDRAVQKKVRASKTKTVNYGELLDEVEASLKSTMNTPETRGEWAAAKSYIDDARNTYKGEATAQSALKLRKRLDKQLNWFSNRQNWSGKDQAIYDFTSKLRDKVAEEVPSIKPLNQKYSVMADLLVMMKKEPTFGIIESMWGALPGMAAGAANPIAAIPAGIIGGKIGQAVRSPGLRRSAAIGMQGLKQQIPQQIGAIGRGGLEALRRALSN